MIGLIWNSMMSWAGGWFFLMASEQFTSGSHSFQLPGLGSYLQAAANAGNTGAILLGLLTLILLIVLLDLLFWRPLVAWADKFKVEQAAALMPRTRPYSMRCAAPHLSPLVNRRVFRPLGELAAGLLDRLQPLPGTSEPVKGEDRPSRALTVPQVSRVGAGHPAGGARPRRPLVDDPPAQPVISPGNLGHAASWRPSPPGCAPWQPCSLAWPGQFRQASPLAFRPRWSRRLQPVVQVVASIPATAIFPILLLALVGLPGGLSWAAIVLMLLGTQWYILFNVIAGAMAIPSDLARGLHRLPRHRLASAGARSSCPASSPTLSPAC